jgi:hypothetical protein
MELSDLARSWAKAIAYVRCGKLDDASFWAQKLVNELRRAGVHID